MYYLNQEPRSPRATDFAKVYLQIFGGGKLFVVGAGPFPHTDLRTLTSWKKGQLHRFEVATV